MDDLPTRPSVPQTARVGSGGAVFGQAAVLALEVQQRLAGWRLLQAQPFHFANDDQMIAGGVFCVDLAVLSEFWFLLSGNVSVVLDTPLARILQLHNKYTAVQLQKPRKNTHVELSKSLQRLHLWER